MCGRSLRDSLEEQVEKAEKAEQGHPQCPSWKDRARGAAGEQDNKERSTWREAPAGDTAMKPATRTPDDIRIGACADYILGRPIQKIEERWGVRIETVIRWIKRTGSFKTRQSQAKRGEKRREASPD